MTYAVYPLPILGPVLCKGCGETVYWASRMSRRLGINAPKTAWRDADGTLHRCPFWRAEAVVALTIELEKRDNVAVGISDTNTDTMCDALSVADTSREGVSRLEVSAP